METMLYISLALNLGLLILLLVRELEHERLEESQRLVNRAMREEVFDLVRRGYLHKELT